MQAGARTTSRRSRRQLVLRAHVLGALELTAGGAPVPALESARAESLLAYLLLHRAAPVPRQHLAFLLWPDSSEQQARTNLRHVLHNLRRAWPQVDDFLDVRQRTIQWRADVQLDLDVARFEEALDGGRLTEAVEEYRGDLLEGRYDEWLLEERERLAHRYVDALEQLVRQLDEERRWRDAIAYAERLLRRDPLREETYRLLIRLCDAAGDRARALRVYHECEATLQRELGVEPSPTTREAYEALLDTETPEPRQRQTAPLVGRTDERARLLAAWRAAERGEATAVLVTGEAGVGKSRLVEELRAWCAHAGAITAEARAYAAEGAIAYGALVEWLRAEPVAARVRRLERAHRVELARLLPELRADEPEAPEPLPESEQRRRIFAAAAAALAHADAPVLLILDDLQWADEPSLRLVHYLLRAAPDARLLVAATARREEVDGEAASEVITALHTLGRIEEIALERLTREETALLAEHLAGRALDEKDAARLYAESEGNALFVVEAVRAGDARRARGRVQAVIASRLAQLSEAARNLIGVAATIGRQFSADVLAAASATGDATLIPALDELWRRGLVRAHGPSAYDFSHAKIRDAAYDLLGPAERTRHHRRVAAALATHGAPPAQVASQYDAGGAPAEAVAWYERAAEQAQRLSASRDAIRSLERAIELSRTLPESAERSALELRLLTAIRAPRTSVSGFPWEAVDDVHERAAALAAQLGVDLAPPVVWSRAVVDITRGNYEAARLSAGELRARAERDGDDVLWVQSAYVLGIWAYWQGRLDEARGHFEDALGRYETAQRAEHLLRYGQDPELICRMRLAHTLWLLGREDEAARMRDEALAESEGGGHAYSRSVAAIFGAMLAVDEGDDERLRRHAALLEEPAFDAEHQRLPAEGFAALLDVLDGREADGVRRACAALDAVRAGPPRVPGQVMLQVRVAAEACARAGDAETGLAVADPADAGLWEAEVRRLRARFLRQAGAPLPDVEGELRTALAAAERQGAVPFARRAGADLEEIRLGTR